MGSSNTSASSSISSSVLDVHDFFLSCTDRCWCVGGVGSNIGDSLAIIRCSPQYLFNRKPVSEEIKLYALLFSGVIIRCKRTALGSMWKLTRQHLFNDYTILSLAKCFVCRPHRLHMFRYKNWDVELASKRFKRTNEAIVLIDIEIRIFALSRQRHWRWQCVLRDATMKLNVEPLREQLKCIRNEWICTHG